MSHSKPTLSYGLVAIQLLALGSIALTGPLFAAHPALLLMEGAAGLLGLWAIGTMGIGNFNVTPDVKRSARLVTNGPYRLIRHPMYTALLAGALALVLDAFSPLRLALWLALLTDLVIKLNYEERLLRQDLEGYSTLMQRTKRLIPFLY